MITVDCYTVLLLSLYCPSILDNMNVDRFNWLNNNVNGQLILGLGKLMEETASVFWVDMRYRLCNQLMVPLQGSGGWLTSHMFIVSHCYCEYCSTMLLWVLFHSDTVSTVTVTDYLVVGPGSAPVIGVMVMGMYGTHLKHGQCLQPFSFKKLRTSIDTCDRRSMGCVYYTWQLVFADIINNNKLL